MFPKGSLIIALTLVLSLCILTPAQASCWRVRNVVAIFSANSQKAELERLIKDILATKSKEKCLTHRYGSCGVSAKNLSIELAKKSPSLNLEIVHVITYKTFPFNPLDPSVTLPEINFCPHVHIRTEGGGLIVDPTWKQFFYDQSVLEGEPDVFVGSEADLRAKFRQYQAELIFVGGREDRSLYDDAVRPFRGKLDPDVFIDKIYGLGDTSHLDKYDLPDMKLHDTRPNVMERIPAHIIRLHLDDPPSLALP